jgi:large subunit ribosomal protein L5e
VYDKAGVGPDDLEELYKKVHAAIRANPAQAHKESKKERASKRKHSTKYAFPARKTKAQRDVDVSSKLAIFKAAKAAADEQEEAGADEE